METEHGWMTSIQIACCLVTIKKAHYRKSLKVGLFLKKRAFTFWDVLGSRYIKESGILVVFRLTGTLNLITIDVLPTNI